MGSSHKRETDTLVLCGPVIQGSDLGSDLMLAVLLHHNGRDIQYHVHLKESKKQGLCVCVYHQGCTRKVKVQCVATAAPS